MSQIKNIFFISKVISYLQIALFLINDILNNPLQAISRVDIIITGIGKVLFAE